jgi:hypothetical protein
MKTCELDQQRTPSASTFLVQFWRDWTAGRPRWRGRIEHVQSGSQTAFLYLEEMTAFIAQFVAIPQGQSLAAREVE